MSAESSLFGVLSAAAGVIALTGQRIYPDVIPQDAAMPAIAYQRVGTEFINTIHGAAPLGATVTLEITCVAESRSGAISLANAVVAALAGTDFAAVDQQAAADIDDGLWGAIVNVNFNE